MKIKNNFEDFFRSRFFNSLFLEGENFYRKNCEFESTWYQIFGIFPSWGRFLGLLGIPYPT